MQMHQLDPNWSLPSLIDRTPMAWIVSMGTLLMRVSPHKCFKKKHFKKGLFLTYLKRKAIKNRT